MTKQEAFAIALRLLAVIGFFGLIMVAIVALTSTTRLFFMRRDRRRSR